MKLTEYFRIQIKKPSLDATELEKQTKKKKLEELSESLGSRYESI